MVPKMETLVARISGRIFVGPDLSREDGWVHISTSYAKDVFAAASSIRRWRPSVRWIVKYFTPEIQRIHVQTDRATTYIGNVLKQRSIGEKTEGYEKPVDVLEWVRDSLSDRHKQNFRFQARLAMSLIAAAINTTSGLLVDVILDLAFRPECIDMLREEAAEVLLESGGRWTPEGLDKLKKMDSFVKESQRLNSVVGKPHPTIIFIFSKG